jgi:CRP-like cAMP-binding protein
MSELKLSLTKVDSPYDPRRFDHLSEAEVIRRIGAILATAFLRSERLRCQPPKSGGAPMATARTDQGALLRDDTERQIVKFLQCAGPTSPLVLARTLGISQKVITRRLTRLRASGVCEVGGRTRAVRYRVRDDFSGN